MKFLKIIFLILLLIIIDNSTSLCKVVLPTLNEIVNNAEIIIIGKVTCIEETNNIHKEYGIEKKVTILVEETIKGSETIRKIILFYYPSFSVEPEYIQDERAIFFIKKWKGKYTIVQGYAGKVSIDKGFVKPIFIKGEATSQPLQKFIQRIRSTDK